MNQRKEKNKILIIDFGSQVTKLIARRIRDYKVFSEVLTPKELKKKNIFKNVLGIILSGGPSTVTGKKFPNIPTQIFNLGIPILGICYGLQLIAKHFKGKVITETGESEILLKFHVRPMGKHLDYDWVKIEDELYKVGILKKFTDDKAIILLCPIYELVNFWIEKIKENPLYFLDKESIKWVAPMLDSLGRPFLISDFE